MEKEKNKSGQSLKITLGVCALLLLLTVSYGFLEGIDLLPYITPRLGTSNARLELTYNDCASNRQSDCEQISANLEPGNSISKTFEVKNTGTVTLQYNIFFKELTNTFKNDELVYKLENLTDNTLTIPETPVPYVEAEVSMYLIAENIEIKPNQKHQYRLTVTFLNKDYNQTDNLDAIFSLKMGVENRQTFEVTFDPNGGTVAQTTMSATYNGTYGELPTPTYEGYIFLGWYTDLTKGVEITSETRVTTVADQTLYAHWRKETIADKIIASVNPGNPNFGESVGFDQGVYAMEDDYGTSYYFRGASEYNYVKYGKDKDGNDMYWRIIRINGDGSLRIIYDGTQAYANGVANNDRYAITGQPFNAQYTDAKYVGWMFGGAQGVASTSKEQAQTNETNSDIKTAVDNWYKENIVDTGYADYVADVIFCNDRTTPGKAITGYTSDTGLGYAKNYTAYGAYAKFLVNKSQPKPTFICSEKNDAFTVNESNIGNGSLIYPVGLLTIDEVVTAGGSWAIANTSYYLFKSKDYYSLSLSPSYINGGGVYMFYVNGTGDIQNFKVNSALGAAAPVINLSVDYVSTLTGNGSMENPYRAE